MREGVIDRAAAALRSSGCAFSRRNLFHVVRRLGGERAVGGGFDAFVDGALAARLLRGPLEGLLPPPAPDRGRPLPREWDAYFPAAVLLVDRRELVDLFAASGVLVHARLAVVCSDGSPAPVVAWLRRGLAAGWRAPFGYLHDSATVLYPFFVEPLATLCRVVDGEPAPYADLGLPPDGVPRRVLERGSDDDEPVRELEAVPPAALIAWAMRELSVLSPRDPWLEPIAGKQKRSKS